MADKPRVKAPKQRSTTPSDGTDRTRRLLLVGGIVAALVIAAVLYAAVGRGSGGSNEESVRADLEAVGCTLKTVKALPGQHSISDPSATSDEWNTDPPTSGPHYGFNPDGSLGTAIWGAYTEPLQLARVVHNTEHGGVFIFHGDEVAGSVVEQLQAFYERRKNGTLLAPYPKLGDKIALGAWVAEGEDGKGYLAMCTTYDEGAFSTFFNAFQFKGPERIPGTSLLPGGN